MGHPGFSSIGDGDGSAVEALAIGEDDDMTASGVGWKVRQGWQAVRWMLGFWKLRHG